MQNNSSHIIFLMPYGTGLLVVGQKLSVLDLLFCSFTAPLHLDSMGVFLQEVHSHPSSVLLYLEYRIPSRFGPSGVEISAMYMASLNCHTLKEKKEKNYWNTRNPFLY